MCVRKEIRAPRMGNPRRTVFLGVDRLDYTKGIDLRLHSFRTLLDELRNSRQSRCRSASQTVLVQVAVPGRGVDSYVEELPADTIDPNSWATSSTANSTPRSAIP